jgi:hypothetical protein
MGHASSVVLALSSDKFANSAEYTNFYALKKCPTELDSTPFSEYSMIPNSPPFSCSSSPSRVPGREISRKVLRVDIVQQYDRMLQDPLERRVFIRFLTSEMWRGNLNTQLLENLRLSSKSWEQANSANSLYSASAQRVFEEENYIDRSMTATEDIYDFGLLPEQRRALAIICIFPCFVHLRRYLSYGEGYADGGSATVDAMINNVGWQEDYLLLLNAQEKGNEAPRPEMDYGDFFMNPVHILSSIAQSNEEPSFEKLIKVTSWQHLVNSVVDSLPIGVEISANVSSRDHLFDTCSDVDLWYGNLDFQELARKADVSFNDLKKPNPARLIQAKALLTGQACKGSVRVSSDSNTMLTSMYFTATLPLTTYQQGVSSTHLVSVYHPLSGMYSPSQRALLQAIDFIMFSLGSLLL